MRSNRSCARIAGATFTFVLVLASTRARADAGGARALGDPAVSTTIVGTSSGWQLAGVLGLGPGTDTGLVLAGRLTERTWLEVGAIGFLSHRDALAGIAEGYDFGGVMVPLWLRVEIGDGALRPTIRIGTGLGASFLATESFDDGSLFTMARLMIGATYDLDPRTAFFLEAGPSIYVDIATLGASATQRGWDLGLGARLGISFAI